MKVLCYTLLFIHASYTEAQVNSIPRSSGQKPEIKVKTKVKPARTIADTAEEYWVANECRYPPKSFFVMYREACEVRLKAQTFASGLCQAFFNSSKALCKLEGASKDDVQTMLSIRDLQDTIDDDSLCDTFADIKHTKPELFPSSKGKKEKWYESISSFIFTPDTCSTACSIKNLHPVCFGYMLNYNYIGSTHLSVLSENEDNDDSSDDSIAVDGVKDSSNKNIGEDDDDIDFGSNQNSSMDNIDIKDYDNMDKKASIDLSKLLEQNPDDFADLLNMDDSLLESKEKFQGLDDFGFESEFNIEKFPDLVDANSVPILYRGARPRLRGYVHEGLDRSEEMPMLGAVLGISALLAVVCLMVLFGIRKKIGFFFKHARHNRRNNWNYERVLAVQPDDDDYYE